MILSFLSPSVEYRKELFLKSDEMLPFTVNRLQKSLFSIVQKVPSHFFFVPFAALDFPHQRPLRAIAKTRQGHRSNPPPPG
ncbi:UNVERIFIED_CONTAM: hypothetical protein NCL1_31393 [Trichonephila clavipes]